ncbi:pyruvate:ferredoxin (flavodoxin) oxidoreductase [Fischerella thermalis CCMEE 5273]|uniref:pyruvate:ferredoxin (flavodoxin) oxidoreductase n=1 Tax=Fischerella thermalis TaxID=372787 RepID=UPI000C806D09|nr:pyruvate:ferredoxin (flavodoxin) oxidoreductase [Fischerella thermalis]PMB11720.1 pyruvate:ferredoxin (flavodoxin) oxidoreductase [Fischerella thermalis CCMEE 5273]PLZ32189.1 pyruvate:ferredoxin (flavodoxin) oxidoreductase [Fischerella thermalis WC559]PLZ36755.1 pyruvate:ferredoxin (flavodoxin) oxidoreductase [Fischerella thermalis WC558]PLZ39971.1 pyruvate:ferredoxin (flavodoxin) oxidoreductase [Fischerella thermalis WC542]PLZ46600.1 pyruvate:ferredoxin (flavodoxin) oxidoreductase [Fischer
MLQKNFATIDGNEAVAKVAYQLNEVVAIYPITPSTPMGEWADAWTAEAKPNLWGTVPTIIEMQSEAGVAGSIHGALQTGALTTTFTASQGLLLMIPNMYKIAGELTPTVFHVASRSLATQALSIFGDHSDVMATRATGFALLSSASVQEAHDFALIAQAATLESRIPFLHFFDGFRTSHEISKVELLTPPDLQALIDETFILEHRTRALSPDRPVLRGTAQNPDVYFQARETVNPYYVACPDIVQSCMNKFAAQTSRHYHLFDYHGAIDAERVIVLMGSGCEVVHETVDYLNARGEKVGIVKVRLYRPFDSKRFIETLPKTVKAIAVLDRTKEPGSAGEPLYLDVITAIYEMWKVKDKENSSTPDTLPTSLTPTIIGGRYGLSSKEFTPAMVKAIFDNLAVTEPKNHFTVGINDDLSHSSLDYDPEFSIEPDNVVRAIFYGLGSDGTVGANKNSIKIIGEETENYAQGYFVYDSKKSGSVTTSHLRFGSQLIRSSYLINKANFVACHQWGFLERFDMLKHIEPGGIFLLNSPYSKAEVWQNLPRIVQEQIINKHLKFYVINAYKVARESGMGGHINTVMQVCFFALSGVLSREEAITQIKRSIEKTYGKKGDEIVAMNLRAVDKTLEHLYEVSVPNSVDSKIELPPPVPDTAPEFVREVLGKMIAGCGDEIPVSALPADGTYPTGTAKYEKRNIAQEIPVWDADVCVQCGKCVMVCPHSVIRSKVYDPQNLDNAPATFKSTDAREHDWQGLKFTIQVATEDCTGCGICVDVCPAKNKAQPRLKAINMKPQAPLREQERENWDFFLTIPNPDRLKLKLTHINHQQMQEPLFEFSGACAGCGETPYIKLVSQLFGDRALVANATGCSSIYGGNLPTTPWTKNKEGRGPAWSNSLFEDNAEFGLGFRVSIDKQRECACELLTQLAPKIGEALVESILNAEQKDETEIYEQRDRVAILKQRLDQLLVNLETDHGPSLQSKIQNLQSLADLLVKKSIWIIGGDGWAYDIGFGGLDHVLASGRDVNILVLDTEVYSNTGGQMSKATPRGAVAKFAAAGKSAAKKDLGLIAMSYGNVYVASVAMGARDEHTLKAFLEAEAYSGPSLIIAYSHCIAHGINMSTAMQNQKAAVDSGRWLLYRFNPDRINQGENPLQLDSRTPKLPVEKYMYLENRFKMLTKSYPEQAKRLLQQAQEDVNHRYSMYQYLAAREL